jgi:hypothetical protein
MAQKKNIRAGKKSTQRNHQKKARSPRAMALTARDAVKKQPKSIVAPSRTKPVPSKNQAQTVSGKAAKPIRKLADADGAAVEVAAAPAPQSLFASQMDVFATLLKWSPFGMILRQQSVMAGMMFNMHYPRKSELT